MKIKIIPILFFASIVCKSQSIKTDFLLKDFYEINSLSLGNKELFFLDSILSDKRIVFLGESTHGDGTTWEAKSMIIDHLVKHLGFEVLLLELNLFEMEKANALLNNPSTDSKYVLIEALKHLNYWSTGREKLAKVILNNKKTLTLGGIDISYTNRFRSLLENDLKDFNVKKAKIESYISILNEINLTAHSEIIDNKIVKIDYDAFEKLSYELIDVIMVDKKNENKAELLKQVILSNIGLSKWVKKITLLPFLFENNLAFLNWTEIRDVYMADNLSWLIDRYKGRKIIVSTSTLHMSRNISQVPVMVDHLSSSIKANSFFLPFISYSGSYGQKADIPLYPIKEFKRDSLSLEFYLHKFRRKYGFLNLNSFSEEGVNFINELLVYPSMILTYKNQWKNTYDGFFFIDVMRPDSLMHLSLKEMQNLELAMKKIKK